MKLVVAAIALLVLMFGYNAWQKNTHAAAAATPAVNSAPANSSMAFTEARQTIEMGGRSFDLVMLIEAPSRAGCGEELARKYLRFGEKESPPTVMCLDQLEPRYRAMLDKQPAELTYFHLSDTSIPARAVSVIWGLNAEESRTICGEMQRDFTRSFSYDPNLKNMISSCI